MRLEHLLSGDVRPSVRHTLLYIYDEELVETEDSWRDVRKEQERKERGGGTHAGHHPEGCPPSASCCKSDIESTRIVEAERD